ncbi:hypothetical protein [Geobacillus zalihae]|uniref:hypothetical protein n=1 Tax=Geobacillus zalihae TaxID=213419 RepID=UPI001F61EA3B|nr:hypothetical protein [Geobacillus zalihae]
MEQRFDELTRAGKCAFVDMIGIRRREERSFLLELLASDELELRVRALKAMAEIGMPLEAERLKQHLCSFRGLVIEQGRRLNPVFPQTEKPYGYWLFTTTCT